MTNVNLICGQCKKEMLYALKEYNRQTKKGRTIFFCGLSCARSYKNLNLTDEEKIKRKTLLGKYTKNRKRKFTYYLNKSRNRDKECNLDEQYLESIWTEYCKLSNIKIYIKNGKSNLNTASLDRINSSQGYIKGNVQFVAYGLNLAKNNRTNEEMLAFIQEIKNTV